MIIHHWTAILAAIFVGVLFSLPQVLSRIAIGDAYQGAPFFSQNDDETYLTNIQEIIDGHWTASSPIFDGYKDSPVRILPIGEYLYVLLHFLLGISILSAITLSKFIFPAILFLLVYALIYSLTMGGEARALKMTAVAGALLVLLGYDFADPRYVFSLLRGETEPIYSVMWARLVNPITGGMFLMSYLVLLWHSIRGYRRWTLSILAGLILLFSAGYFFSYATALAITGTLIVITFFRREFLYIQHLLVTIGIGLLPLIIQLSLFVISGVLSGEGGSLSKLGLFYTHRPLINTVLVIACVAFLSITALFYRKDKDKEPEETLWWWFSLSILLGLMVAYIQQLVTGLTIWPQHFVQYSIPIVYIVGMTTFYKIIFARSRKLWLVGIIVIFLSTFGWGIWMTTLYHSRLAEYSNSQRYMSSFEWLNKEAQKDCVVFAIEDSYLLSNKITAYTHCNVYYSMNTLYGLPQERIEHGYLSWLSFRGVQAENIEEYLTENKEEVYTTSFTNWMEKFRASDYSWLKAIQDEEALNRWEAKSIKHLSEEYKSFKKKDFETELKKYKLDYILWDKVMYPDWDPNKFAFLELVFEDDRILIFKVR